MAQPPSDAQPDSPATPFEISAATAARLALGKATPRRSLGLKLLLVCALALLMSIPALFVFGLLMDRSNRADRVATEVGDLMGGKQTFLGPVIAIPYSRSAGVVAASQMAAPVAPAPNLAADRIQTGVWYVFPAQGRIDVDTDSEVRRRSLFRVAVYEAQVGYSAQFDLARAGAEAPAGAVLDWSRAEILVGASDARGARSDITLKIGGRNAVLTPSTLDPSVALTTDPGVDMRSATAPRSELKLFGTPLNLTDRAGGLQVSGRATFSGAQRISVLPFAGTTEAAIKGDWPHPSYNGGFLPTRRETTDGRFDAAWSVPFVARGIPAEGDAGALARLGAADLAVSFVEPANPYQSVSRSLKYAPMFIGLVFLAFFLFETTTGRRVHPAQYILIGLAQVIFYMLLLSIAEHTGFDIGFALAATATVALISAYAGWTFDSRRQGIRALIAFTFLYGLIYVLMRLEDYALLVGALASFAAIFAVMYFTRKLDWYGITGAAAKDIS
ncbi:cell envelope integrity protein CreD [uncultured Brevundimonas sp.]|uniref:cell envelope integrity protein CreD n=1 Tax=uncultured Brevundimonas sp. TaxID=213418 RepID=UPI002607AC5D|nr:cell envelope integrity protein CreD [uncultured Brevundimonas sp.]